MSKADEIKDLGTLLFGMLSDEFSEDARDGLYDEFHAAIDAQQAETERLKYLLGWAYGKLNRFSFTNIDDALNLDEMKLVLEHGSCN